MVSRVVLLLSMIVLSTFVVTNAFVSVVPSVQQQRLLSSSSRHYAVHIGPVVNMDVTIATSTTMNTNHVMLQDQHPSVLDNGIRSYYNTMEQHQQSTSSVTTSTQLVSLQERKIPTKEEIDQKKLTFNLIFWGGGFVAPFIATVFYFGFRFWEK